MIVDETRSGRFNGLIIASYTSALSIMHHLVPLLAGGAQIVVYNPHIEPLVELADLYSTARRTAFIQLDESDPQREVPSEDFPVDPTFLLTPGVQTGRVRRWQVLPGRTHPLMMSKGGAEGYLFVGTRVIPAEGRITARGRAKRGKAKKPGAELNAEEIDVEGEYLEQDDVEYVSKKIRTEPSDQREVGAEQDAVHGDTMIETKTLYEEGLKEKPGQDIVMKNGVSG